MFLFGQDLWWIYGLGDDEEVVDLSGLLEEDEIGGSITSGSDPSGWDPVGNKK
ncbi:MAG: hypothetical protein H0W71_01785 [Sphingomonas sp.]|nr:hypothetical protein [Sphingomonas sp.]